MQPSLLASYFTLAGDVNPFNTPAVSPIALRTRIEAAASADSKALGCIRMIYSTRARHCRISTSAIRSTTAAFNTVRLNCYAIGSHRMTVVGQPLCSGTASSKQRKLLERYT